MEESLSKNHVDRIRSGEDKRAEAPCELFGVYWRQMLLVFLLTAGGSVCFHVYTVVAPRIVKDTFTGQDAIVVTTISLSTLVILTGCTSINAIVKAEQFPGAYSRPRVRVVPGAGKFGFRWHRALRT